MATVRKATFLCGLVLILSVASAHKSLLAAPATPLAFDVRLAVVRQELRPDFCWFHPRVAPIPGAGHDGRPAVVMTLQKHLGVSDHYSGLWMMRTDDLGQTWTGPTEISELVWVTEPSGVVRAVADVTPGWHPQTGKLIAMGCTVRYGKSGEQLSDVQRFSQTAYAVYDPTTARWSQWQVLDLPGDDKFNMARNACAQWLVLPDSTLLVPIYFATASNVPASVTVLHCAFDGQKLTYLKHGDEYMAKGQASPRGANGSVFAARVLWSKPNDLAPPKAR